MPLLQPAGHSVGSLLAALQRHMVQAHICSMRLAACIWQQQHPPQRLHPPLLYRVRPRSLPRQQEHQLAALSHSLPDGLVNSVHAAGPAQGGPHGPEAAQGKLKHHGPDAAVNAGKAPLGKPWVAESQQGRQLALPLQASEFCLPLWDPVGRLPGTGQVALQHVGLQELLLQAEPAAPAAPAPHAVAPPADDLKQGHRGGLPGSQLAPAALDARQAWADPGVAALQADGHEQEPDGRAPAGELGPAGSDGRQALADPVIAPSEQNGAARPPKRKRQEGSPGLDDAGPAAAKRWHAEAADELLKRKRQEGSPGLDDAGPAAAKRRHVGAADELTNGHSSRLATVREQPAVSGAASHGGGAVAALSADARQLHLQLRVLWPPDWQRGDGCCIHCHPEVPPDMLRSLERFVGEDHLLHPCQGRSFACRSVPPLLTHACRTALYLLHPCQGRLPVILCRFFHNMRAELHCIKAAAFRSRIM